MQDGQAKLTAEEVVVRRSCQLRQAEKELIVARRTVKEKQAAMEDASRRHADAVDRYTKESVIPP